MKREIKFRLWNTETKVMYADSGISSIGINEGIKKATMCNYELMQYTGLKDKNGVEIYEGDIVEYDGHTRAKVIFKSGCFIGYDGYATSSDEAYLLLEADSTPFNGDEFELEVIGNIYENPDLLTNQKENY